MAQMTWLPGSCSNVHKPRDEVCQSTVMCLRAGQRVRTCIHATTHMHPAA